MRTILNSITIASLPVILILVSGCATYEPTKKTYRISKYINHDSSNVPRLTKYTSHNSSNEPRLKEVIMTQDSISIHLSPYIDYSLCQKYLGIEPNKAHIIPSLLKIENNSSRLLTVVLEKCSLEISGTKSFPLSLQDAIDKAKLSYAKVVVYAIVFGVPTGGILAILTANNITSVNQSLEEDWHLKYFQPALINPGTISKGVVFNQFPRIKELHHCIFKLSMMDMKSQQEFTINLQIPDSVMISSKPKEVRR